MSACLLGEYELNGFYDVDCIRGMASMPDNCVDLIVADPPYNLSKGSNWKWDNSVSLPGMGGDWAKVMESWDTLSLNDYWKFTAAWIMQAKRILRPTGSMWIFGTYHNIGVINTVLQMQKVEIINEVIWFKRNAFPNLSGRRLTASHETILWCHSGAPKRQYYFDYEFAKNGVFAGDQIKQPGKQMRTVWDIPNNKQRRELEFGKHPTQKPLRLLDRIIRLSSRPGDIILSPFSGAGSECLAAYESGRQFLGLEIDSGYNEIARNRLRCAAEPIIENETIESMTLFDLNEDMK